MHLLRLHIERLRLFEQVEFEPGSGINLFVGPNGAGKTSLLEAVYLLGYGRSFRGGGREAPVRRGAESLEVFAELAGTSGVHRLGLRRSGKDWEARLDGAPVSTLSDLFARCAVVCFEPGSHELIAGPAELRRRFLDWGLFHVEPSFLGVWRSYQRALRQRNALLRQGRGGDELLPWERELGRSGAELDRMRRGYIAALSAPLASLTEAIFPGPGAPTLHYASGWPSEEGSLEEMLPRARARDTTLGYTSFGPHRANWNVRYPTLPVRSSLSRGQEKLSALCCILAQAQHYAHARGDWPIVCLDDLGSELDRDHQARAVAWLAAQPAQMLVTGTETPNGFESVERHVFHVEQGSVQRLL
jgi:DNA replication and repair protein RecF